MKVLLTFLALTSSIYCSAQLVSNKGYVKLENFSINVTVDSIKDLKSTFKVGDFEDVLEDVAPNQAILFKLTCNNQSKNGRNNISYTITGNSNKPEAFLEHIQKVRKSAIEYYKNKA